MNAITDKTKVSLALLVSLLGGCAWLTEIYFEGRANAQTLVEVKAKQEKLDDLVVDVAIIKTEVHEMNKKLDRL